MVALAADLGLALVDEQRRPGGHGRVDVAEVPLVGGDLAVGMHVAGREQQLDLLLGEVDVDQRQRRAMERQVPGREPRILPLVRHRDDVAREHVKPRDVADTELPGASGPTGRRRARAASGARRTRSTACPTADPRAPGASPSLVRRQRRRESPSRRTVGLDATRRSTRSKPAPSAQLPASSPCPTRRAGQTEADRRRSRPAAMLENVVGGHLRAGSRAGLTASAAPATTKSLIPSLTYGEAFGAPNRRWLLVSLSQNRSVRRGVGVQRPLAEIVVRHRIRRGVGRDLANLHARLGDVVAPRPGVAKPQRREQVERRRVWAAVVGGDQHQDVVGGRLGVLHDHVEVAVVVEDPGVEQLVLHVLLAAPRVGGQQIVVREFAPADTCTGTSGTSGSACCRGRTSTP